MKIDEYDVYIMASMSGTLYVGVTSNLKRRVAEHKSGLNKSFTQKYQCKKLVYYETFLEPSDAIRREKEIKTLLRSKKEALIRYRNPMWFDLASRWHLPPAVRYEKE